jgi:hypothetical protein
MEFDDIYGLDLLYCIFVEQLLSTKMGYLSDSTNQIAMMKRAKVFKMRTKTNAAEHNPLVNINENTSGGRATATDR